MQTMADLYSRYYRLYIYTVYYNTYSIYSKIEATEAVTFFLITKNMIPIKTVHFIRVMLIFKSNYL